MEKHTKANLAWVIFTLIALLILAITWRLPLPSKSADMMSFAATMCSMALAIFAIFQSLMYAVDASREKREASAFNARTATLLESIDRQIPDLGREVRQVREQLSSLKGYEPQSATSAQSQIQGSSAQQADAVKIMIGRASAAGLLALRAAVLSHGHKKPIDLDIFLDAQLTWHTAGFISGLSATNWLNFNFAGTEISVTTLNQHIVDAYEQIVSAFDIQPISPDEGVYAARDRLLKYYGVTK
jgi:hypothetical protein